MRLAPRARCVSGRLGVSGEVSGILLAGVTFGALGESAAGVLPSLALVVPMKAELREYRGDFAGLLLGELNPDPLADNLGQVEEAGRFLLEECKNLVGRQLSVGLTAGVVDSRQRRTLRRLLCGCLNLRGCVRNRCWGC